jgi:hypothetical protein
MSTAQPPIVATSLLKRLGSGPNNDALVGARRFRRTTTKDATGSGPLPIQPAPRRELQDAMAPQSPDIFR